MSGEEIEKKDHLFPVGAKGFENWKQIFFCDRSAKYKRADVTGVRNRRPNLPLQAMDGREGMHGVRVG